ncbi:hypothetical protein [Polaribacter sp.]
MKKLHINYFIVTIFLLVFVIQYYLIESYFERMFQYTTYDVKIEIINTALKDFKWYVLQNIIILIFQWLGLLLCLNIGFLYFGLNSSFKNILNLIVYSLLATVTFQLLLVILVQLNNWTFSVGSLKAMSSNLSLASYFTIEKTAPWIQLSLSSINLEQLFILIILALGMHKIIKLSIKRAFSITIRTYGLGILLWFVFAMVMEMNFI